MQLNERDNQGEQKNHESLKRICPFVEDPHEDCYCFGIMNSLKVSQAVYYCGNNFEECEIYKRIF